MLSPSELLLVYAVHSGLAMYALVATPSDVRSFGPIGADSLVDLAFLVSVVGQLLLQTCILVFTIFYFGDDFDTGGPHHGAIDPTEKLAARTPVFMAFALMQLANLILCRNDLQLNLHAGILSSRGRFVVCWLTILSIQILLA